MNFKARIIILIIGLISFGTGIVLTLYWYDWKLLVILLVLQFSWNIDNELKRTRAERQNLMTREIRETIDELKSKQK